MPLSPRQVIAYTHRCEIWRFQENAPAADGQYQGRTWSRIAQHVPCHFVMRGGPLGPQGGLIRAEGEDLITMDRFHFALDVDIEADDEVMIEAGARAGFWWKLTEDPEPREWRANKQEVIAIRIERPTRGN